MPVRNSYKNESRLSTTMSLNYCRDLNDRNVTKIPRSVCNGLKLSLFLRRLTNYEQSARGPNCSPFFFNGWAKLYFIFLSSFQITAHLNLYSRTSYGVCNPILTTSQYGPRRIARTFASPRSVYCLFAPAPSWILSSTNVFTDAAGARSRRLSCRKMRPREVV